MTVTNALRAQIIRAVNALLTDSCTIMVEASGSDEFGAPTRTWSVAAANVPCRVIVLNRMREAAGQEGGRITIPDVYRLIVPAGTGLEVGQYIVLASDGQRYEIVDLVTARTDGPDEQAIIARAR